MTKASQRYHLPYTTVENWAKKVVAGQQIIEGTGRPKATDAIASEKFVNTLLERRKMKNAVPVAEALLLLGQAVSDTGRVSSTASQPREPALFSKNLFFETFRHLSTHLLTRLQFPSSL